MEMLNLITELFSMFIFYVKLLIILKFAIEIVIEYYINIIIEIMLLAKRYGAVPVQ